MPPLADLQQDFAAALIDHTRALPDGIVAHTAQPPDRRFNVYRNNVMGGLAGVLGARFPVVQRLVGDVFFAAMAREFIAAGPPRSPVLLEYGGRFAEFIAAFAPAADTPYLPDVARLEWLQNEAYHAADRSPIEEAGLAAIPADRLADTILELHPSLRLLRSPYPVIAIWRTNVEDETVQAVSLASGGDDVLIIRPALQVELRRLKPGALEFLQTIAAGNPLGMAFEAASAASDHFDLQSSLAGLIQSGGIVGYRLQ